MGDLSDGVGLLDASQVRVELLRLMLTHDELTALEVISAKCSTSQLDARMSLNR